VIPNIERDILIEAPVDVVWRAITEPSQISNWFSDAAELDLKPGGEGALTFTDKARNRPTVARISVQSVEPPRTFAYRWLHPEGEQARTDNSVLVEFTLTPEGDGTRLRVTETGLAELPWTEEDKAKYVEEHTEGWNHHLGDLNKHVSTAPAQ
jgi:uncharacterized protein YndB with AHSA1/START domain